MDLFGDTTPVDSAMKITELERELSRRRAAYDRVVKRGSMGALDAKNRIRILELIIEDYKGVSASGTNNNPVSSNLSSNGSIAAADAIKNIKQILADS